MSLWAIITGLTLLAVAALVVPIFRGRVALRPRLDDDLKVFRDQLAEVDRDIELGVLKPEQAEAVRTEVRRRMVSAAATKDDAVVGDGKYLKVVAVVVAVAVPAASIGLYRGMGSPELPDQPYLQVQAARLGGGHDVAAVQAMVDKLAARLKGQPMDPDGWLMLGRSYRTLGRNDDAVAALGKATSQAPGSALAWSMLGEAIAAANQGMVVSDARDALLRSVRLDPQDARARFYLGLARSQIGDAKGAIAVWRDLEAESPADAPWYAQLKAKIAEVSKGSGIDPLTIAPRGELALSGTASPDLPPAAMAQGEPAKFDKESIEARVDSLAAKLQANPNDGAGWAMLGRSYGALGEKDKSREAYVKAMGLNPRDIGVRMAYAETLVGDDADTDHLPEAFITAMREILGIDQDQPDALYYVGLAEAQAGHPKDAAAYWQRLLGALPKGSAEYQQLDEQIQSLR